MIQNNFYNKLLEKSIKLIVDKLLFFLISTKDIKVNQNINNLLLNEDHTKFFKHIRKIQKYLAQIDKNYNLEPKFSDTFIPLYKFIKENCDSDTVSN